MIKSFRSIFVKKTLGATLMISGSCIGIGMLAIPVSTSFAGFIPTLVSFILCWFFMLTTALYLVDVSEEFSEHKNLISLTGGILGNFGKIVTWCAFTFLFYCLLIAYVAKGGELVQLVLKDIFPFHLPAFAGPLVLSLMSACLVYFGTLFVDRFNGICMVGLVGAYFSLIISNRSGYSPSYLFSQDWNYFLFILPFIIPAFGFHNLIPTLKEYLLNDLKKTRLAIYFGSMIPLVVYVLWVMSIQGMLHPSILQQSFHKGQIATEVLSAQSSNSAIGLLGSYFAFFAIITSLITQSLSVVDFFSDGLKLKPSKINRLIIVGVVFIPAFLLSQISPGVFFLCLDWAGGVATMVLFGLIPAAMLWKLRKNSLGTLGKIQLLCITIFALLIIGYELSKYLF